MAKLDDRRTPTLSISLTPELLGAVDARVKSGLYTSASELVREALRLFLQVEQARQAKLSGLGPARDALVDRLATTFDLFDFGSAIAVQKLRTAEPGITDEEVERRRLSAAQAIETDAVIRPSPERLKRLRIDVGPR
ncbi:MAG: type II toxin-antitoxin system ParD family antitoxin [Planctomycetota bacterium]